MALDGATPTQRRDAAGARRPDLFRWQEIIHRLVSPEHRGYWEGPVGRRRVIVLE